MTLAIASGSTEVCRIGDVGSDRTNLGTRAPEIVEDLLGVGGWCGPPEQQQVPRALLDEATGDREAQGAEAAGDQVGLRRWATSCILTILCLRRRPVA